MRKKENANVGTTEFTISCTLYYHISNIKILGRCFVLLAIYALSFISFI